MFYVALGEIKVWLNILKPLWYIEWQKNLHLGHQIVFSEDEEITMVDKFNGNNINVYKFKLKMVLATKDFWKIVDGLEALPPYTAIDK